MLKLTTFMLIMLLNIQTAIAQKIVFSHNVSIDIPTPEVIAHSGELLIFKYNDWYFSHEAVNPKTFFSLVDLSGIEHNFIKKMYGIPPPHKQPEWLNELAKELAISFGISEKNAVISNIEKNTVLSNFIESKQEGNIFFLEKHKIHKIYFSGNKSKFTTLLNKLKGNKNGT